MARKRHRRKQRTRELVIEEMSVNFLERQVLRRSHLLQIPVRREYGCDATMFHFAPDSEMEWGEMRFQLKATDRLKTIAKGKFVSYSVDIRHLHFWSFKADRSYPFILVVYDALKHRAFWLDVQSYVDNMTSNIENLDQDTVTVRISPTRKADGQTTGESWPAPESSSVVRFEDRPALQAGRGNKEGTRERKLAGGCDCDEWGLKDEFGRRLDEHDGEMLLKQVDVECTWKRILVETVPALAKDAETLEKLLGPEAFEIKVGGLAKDPAGK